VAWRLIHRLQEAGVPVGGFMTAELRNGGRREGFLVDALPEQLVDRLVGALRGEQP
jgi:nucleoside-triphosphatase THEP1